MTLEACISIWPILNCNRCSHLTNTASLPGREFMLLFTAGRSFKRASCGLYSWIAYQIQINSIMWKPFFKKEIIQISNTNMIKCISFRTCIYKKCITCSLTLTWSGNWVLYAKNTGVHNGSSFPNTDELHSMRASIKSKKWRFTISANTLECDTSWSIPETIKNFIFYFKTCYL